MRGARIGLRRLATALAAVGAVLLVIAPMLPLAEGAPVDGLQNSLFWRPPPLDWIALLLAAATVPVALALWDSTSRARPLGALLLMVSGAGVAMLALSLQASDVFDSCNWSSGRGLHSGLMFDRCLDSGRYEPAEALGAALLGGTLLLFAGFLLPLSKRFSVGESERRRTRLRSLVYL